MQFYYKCFAACWRYKNKIIRPWLEAICKKFFMIACRCWRQFCPSVYVLTVVLGCTCQQRWLRPKSQKLTSNLDLLFVKKDKTTNECSRLIIKTWKFVSCLVGIATEPRLPRLVSQQLAGQNFFKFIDNFRERLKNVIGNHELSASGFILAEDEPNSGQVEVLEF